MAGRSERFPDLVLGPAYQDRQVLAGRCDYALFDSRRLPADLRVVGSAGVTVHVQCECRDTDVVVRLCDYDPDAPEGERTLLLMTGALRLRYAGGRESPSWLEPDRTYRAELELDPIGHTFAAGHQVRLIVSSSSYPMYALNPNNGEDFVWQEGREVSAAVSIHHDSRLRSAVILPVMSEE
jgi:putative CocE/NonD family hydrolase